MLKKISICVGLLIVPVWGPGQIVVDGEASDWMGVAGATLHGVVVDQGEWIYTGEAGDLRTHGAGVWSNYDITEVRLTRDDSNLYVLVRFADITNIDEVSVCLGIDLDQSAGDANGLAFLGDESGVTFTGAQFHPDYIVQIHNAQPGITWAEYFHDLGSGFWYSNSGDADTYISATNNLLEARLSLASLGLTPTSVFGFSLATFDNGTTADSGAVAFCNDDDTTVDYPDTDALDAVGGASGVSENAWTRVFGASGPYNPSTVPPVDLAQINGATRLTTWLVLE